MTNNLYDLYNLYDRVSCTDGSRMLLYRLFVVQVV